MLFMQPFTQQFVPVSVSHLCDVSIFIHLVCRDAWHMSHVAVSFISIDVAYLLHLLALLHRDLALYYLLQ